MKSNIFLRVIIVLFCIWLAIPAQAEIINETEAKQWTEEKGRELLSAFGEPNIEAKYKMLDEILVTYVDLDYVSKFVLGKYWRQMTAEQQQEYQEVFKRYALSIYKGFPLDFDTESINFEITKVTPTEKNTNVHTRIKLPTTSAEKQSPISDIFVDFILHKQNGNIQIIDLKLGESSLILSYRSRFYEMITKNDDDITWFLEDLSDITEAAERTNQEKLQQAEY